jgi:hypothetical protein
MAAKSGGILGSLFVLALSAASSATAQTVPPRPSSPAGQKPAKAQIARWLDLQNVSLNMRFRVIDNSAGVVTTKQLQHRETLRGRLKGDPAGRYALNFGAFTGARFTSGWDNTPWGISDTQKNFAFKQLFFSAQPVAGIEAQVGGLYIVKGESTEITSYDDDGYVMGERFSVRRPKDAFFDEISFTNAYLTSDSSRIAVNKRFSHIDEPNYRQFLLDKKIGKRVGISGDFTSFSGAHAWREAINLKTPGLGAIDSVEFENYERTNASKDYGFAVWAEKAVTKQLIFNGGYASIDPKYGGLNSDRFNIGNRVFLTTTYVLSPAFTASAFITTAVGANAALPQRTLLNLILAYNALPDLRRTGLF